jgi:hypothetical protein
MAASKAGIDNLIVANTSRSFNSDVVLRYIYSVAVEFIKSEISKTFN